MKPRTILLITIILLISASCKKEPPKPATIINPDLLIGKQRKMTERYKINSDGEFRDMIELDTIFTGSCWMDNIYEYTETKYHMKSACENYNDIYRDWMFNEDSGFIYHLRLIDYNYDTTKYEILELSENILKTQELLGTDSSEQLKVITTFEVIK